MEVHVSAGTRRRSGAIVIGSVSAAALMLAGCTASPPAPDGGSTADIPEMTLTVADLGPETSSTGRGVTALIEYVEEATDGRVTFETYFSSSLFPGAEALTQTGAGVADMALMSVVFAPNELPIGNWLLNYGSANEPSHPFGAIQGTLATWQLYEENPDVRAELEKQNVIPLGATSTTGTSALCRDEVTTPEAAAVQRARVAGDAWTAEAESLGMTPQYLSPTEAYESIQRGLLDCVVFAPSNLAAFGIWEVATHFLALPFSSFPGSYYIVNLDTWNSFPDELKQIFLEASVEYIIEYVQSQIDLQLDFATRGESDHGIIYDDVSALYDDFVAAQKARLAQVVDNAPAGVPDAAAMDDEYLGYLDAWADFLKDSGIKSASTGSFSEDAQAAAELDWQSIVRDAMLAEIAGKYSDR